MLFVRCEGVAPAVLTDAIVLDALTKKQLLIATRFTAVMCGGFDRLLLSLLLLLLIFTLLNMMIILFSV